MFVRCSQEGEIEKIVMHGNGLKGVLDVSIFKDMPNLSLLDLNVNKNMVELKGDGLCVDWIGTW